MSERINMAVRNEPENIIVQKYGRASQDFMILKDDRNNKKIPTSNSIDSLGLLIGNPSF